MGQTLLYYTTQNNIYYLDQHFLVHSTLDPVRPLRCRPLWVRCRLTHQDRHPEGLVCLNKRINLVVKLHTHTLSSTFLILGTYRENIDMCIYCKSHIYHDIHLNEMSTRSQW